jgi:hypothetical protein
MNPSLQIFLLSHDGFAKLEDKGNFQFISHVDLNKLDIPKKFQGQMLAESRFFISEIASRTKSNYVGLATPRWGERFPRFATLPLIPNYIGQLPPCSFLAPQALGIRAKYVDRWILAQDVVHPGISKYLLPLWHEINKSNKGLRWLPTGNCFILPLDLFLSLVEFMRKQIAQVEHLGMAELDFSYRCPICRKTSREGLGRWNNNRHASFLVERITALFIASHPELSSFTIEDSNLIARKRFMFDSQINLISRLYLLSPKLQRQRQCSHISFGPGKRR